MQEKAEEIWAKGYEGREEQFIGEVNALLGGSGRPFDPRLTTGTLTQRLNAAIEILSSLMGSKRPYGVGRIKKKRPPENVYVGFNPTGPETEESVDAMARVEQHRQTLAIAGHFELDDEAKFEINESLKSLGIKPEELNLENRHFDVAFAIHSQGGSSDDFERKIDEAEFLTKEDRLDLHKSNMILKGLEESQKDLTKDLQLAYRHPEIVLQTFVPEIKEPNFQVLSLKRTDQKLSPNISEFFASTKAIAEEGVKKVAGEALDAAKQGAKKIAVAEVKKLGKTAVKEGGKQFLKKGAQWLAAKLGISLVAGAATGGVSTAIQIIYEVLKLLKNIAKKLLSSILRILTGEKDPNKALGRLGLLMVAGGLAIGSTGLAFAGAGVSLVSHLSSVGFAAAGTDAMNLIQATFLGVVTLAAPIFTPAIIAVMIGVPLFVIFTVFIINNSALVVPFGTFGEFNIPPPPGGLAGPCEESEETGPEITNELAALIQNGEVHLLPETVWGRGEGICITPTLIVMHWSGGTNDNPDGNLRTYETLVARNLSCQLATDTNDTWLMEKFYEFQTELPACAGEWNIYSINNEMAGIYFTDTPPPPNLDELELTYDATCKVMAQYNIPWCQIYGHFEVPNNGGKTDPGADFLYNVFIPEIKDRCPNDDGNACAGVTRP